MTAEPMRGIWHAKLVMRDHFQTEFPTYLAELRTEWGVTLEDLPNPVEYRRNEPENLDRLPIVAFAGFRTPEIRRVDYGEAALEIIYDVTYSMRAFAWCKEAGWDNTIVERDLLTSAVRRFLVDSPLVGQEPDQAVIEENSIVEEYSDVTPVKGDRYVAGAFVAFELTMTEAIRRVADGTVDQTEVHPALLDV